MTTEFDKETYFAQAGTWATSQIDELRASRRIAWFFAIGLCAVAIAEAGALILLMPLKTVEPYTLLVDRNTGYVQALAPLNATRIDPDRALTQSFLVQYVIAREGYDPNTLNANFRKVALWSGSAVRSRYVASMQAGNPGGPIARLGRGGIETWVKSVSFLPNRTALVRFDTRERSAGAAAGPWQSWISAVHYGFSTAALSQQDRFINPLGFAVSGYQRSQETSPPPTPASPARTGSGGRPDIASPSMPPATGSPRTEPLASDAGPSEPPQRTDDDAADRAGRPARQ